jgi:hypothetical protein
MRLKLVHLYYGGFSTGASGSPFTSRYDLVQVVEYPTPPSIALGSMTAQGADIDYSGNITQSDLSLYASWFAESTPGADQNGDDTVDAEDLSEFLHQYSGVE